MIEYEIPPLTLAQFIDAREIGLGDWLDPLVFLKRFRDVEFVARATLRVAAFEGERPRLDEFLDSICGDDLLELRKRLMRAYINFFPTPERVALLALTEMAFPDLKNTPPVGAKQQ